MVLQNVSAIREAVGAGDEGFAYISKGVFSLGAVGGDEVLGKYTVAGEHAEDALEVFWISMVGG